MWRKIILKQMVKWEYIVESIIDLILFVFILYGLLKFLFFYVLAVLVLKLL